MEDAGKNPQEGIPTKGNQLREAVKKLSEFESRVRNEVIWPIGSILFTLRPAHIWITGNRAKVEKGDKVLEVGGGYPLYKIYSDRVGEDGVFVSLDINPGVQNRSKKIGYWIDRILKRQRRDELIAADAGKLPFTDSSFDVVIASNLTTGGFIRGNREYIKEAYRVLKPGGRLGTSFLEGLSFPYYSRMNAKACKEAGFEDIKMRPGLSGFPVPGMSWNWDVTAKKPESNTRDLNSKVSISEV